MLTNKKQPGNYRSWPAARTKGLFGCGDRPNAGFSIVEMLITLGVAALFILIFTQIYQLASSVSAQAYQLAVTNQITYSKVQQYENTDFAAITTPGGATPTVVEDFKSTLPSYLPRPITAQVTTAVLTPTLKAVDVKATYGTGGAQHIVEYTTYIQASGVGR